MCSIFRKRLQYTSQNSLQFLFLSIPQDSLQGSRHWKIKKLKIIIFFKKAKKWSGEIASLAQQKQITWEAGCHVVRHMTDKHSWILTLTFLERVAHVGASPCVHGNAESFTGGHRRTAGRAFAGCNFMLKWETVGREAIWRRTTDLLYKSENRWIYFFVLAEVRPAQLPQLFLNSGTKNERKKGFKMHSLMTVPKLC